MGGRHGEVEWNLGACEAKCGGYANVAQVSNETLALWPTRVPLVFIDFESGVDIQTGGAGSGDGTVVEAAPLAETLAVPIERNKGDEHHVVLGKLHWLTVDRLVDAEAPSDRLGR